MDEPSQIFMTIKVFAHQKYRCKFVDIYKCILDAYWTKWHHIQNLKWAPTEQGKTARKYKPQR